MSSEDSVLSPSEPGHPDLSTWRENPIPSGCFCFLHIHLSSGSSSSVPFTLLRQLYSLSCIHSLSLLYTLAIHKEGGDKIKHFMIKMSEGIAVTVTTCQCHSLYIFPSNQLFHLFELCCSLESFSINVKIKDKGWRRDFGKLVFLNVGSSKEQITLLPSIFVSLCSQCYKLLQTKAVQVSPIL